MDPTPERPSARDHLMRVMSPRAKAGLAKLLCHPLVGRFIAAASHDRIRSGPLLVHTEDPIISPRTKAQIFWGIYESAEIRMLRRHLRSDLDLLEVGSSLGVVSSHAVDCLPPEARVVCVEANPDLIGTIRKNLDTNHPGREVIVLNRAVDYETTLDVTRMRLTEDTVGSKLDRFDSTGSAAVREVDVPTTTLSKLVSEYDLEEFALISDIEGAEAGFIFSETSELDGCRQMIIELHDTKFQGRRLRWQDLRDELCDRFGFQIIADHGPVHVLER